MKRLLAALALLWSLQAQQPAAPPHWLLTFQLAPGLDIRQLTPQHMAVFAEHGKHLATLQSKGLIVGGRTEEPAGTLAVLIMACDEATAKDAVESDPASRAGYLKGSVHPFSLLIPPAPPAVLVADTKANYEAVAKYLLDAARAMPPESYSFRPVPELRTFAQLVGHIAEAQYIACSLVRGQDYQPRQIDRLVAKDELVPALEAAVGFCRESWNRLVPGQLADPITLFGQKRTKLGTMDIATAHAFEHYGNMVTYLRMKGIVPPSSAK